jgi:hypothetical protein
VKRLDNGGAVLKVVEIEATRPMKQVGFGSGEGEGHHEFMPLLPLPITTLADPVGTTLTGSGGRG